MENDPKMKCQLLVLGAGNMAGCLVKAIAENNILPKDGIHLVTQSEASRDKWRAAGYRNSFTIREFADGDRYDCHTIMLGVKPQYRQSLYSFIRENGPFLEAKIVVSMLAGVKVNTIENEVDFVLGKPTFIRITPNIPTAVGSGVTLICGDSRGALDKTKALLSATGAVIELPESVFNAASAVAGSGPAFAFMMLEGLADGGVAAGLPREQSRELAALMMKGAAEMALKSGRHTAELKDQVCSPAGTTIAGVRKLEESGLRAALMNAVLATKERSDQLA